MHAEGIVSISANGISIFICKELRWLRIIHRVFTGIRVYVVLHSDTCKFWLHILKQSVIGLFSFSILGSNECAYFDAGSAACKRTSTSNSILNEINHRFRDRWLPILSAYVITCIISNVTSHSNSHTITLQFSVKFTVLINPFEQMTKPIRTGGRMLALILNCLDSFFSNQLYSGTRVF